MKIAYLSTFYPYRGGIAQFNAQLYRELEKDHEVKAYTFTRQYPDLLFPGKTQMVSEEDTADEIPSIRVLDTVNPASYIITANEIKKFQPDILITKFWMPYFGPSLGWVCRSLKNQGCLNISILDNVIPHEKRTGDKSMTKFYLKNNHAYIVMSDTVKNDLLTLMPKATFEFQYHPIYDHFGAKVDQDEARDVLDIPRDKKVLLFFGFIRKYKGLDLLLETLYKLDKDIVLLIGGEVYGDFNYYDGLIKKYGLEDRVYSHIRYIDDNEVPIFFSAADACILPYRDATQSGIIGISYHFDIPVIATDTGSLKEVIEPYETGLVAEEAESEYLKTQIERYFNEKMRPILEANIHRFKKDASWRALSDKIILLTDHLSQY